MRSLDTEQISGASAPGKVLPSPQSSWRPVGSSTHSFPRGARENSAQRRQKTHGHWSLRPKIT